MSGVFPSGIPGTILADTFGEVTERIPGKLPWQNLRTMTGRI